MKRHFPATFLSVLVVWALQPTSATAEDHAGGASSSGGGEVSRTVWTAPRPVTRPLAAGADSEPDRAVAVTFLTTNDDPEGDLPREIAVTPDGSTAVIVNRDTDNMAFLDLTTQTVTHTVALQDFPVHVAVTPDGQYAVAPNVFADTVSVVHIPTHTALAHVPVTGEQPYRVATTSDSRYVIAGLINDAVNSAFSVIDLATLTEVRTFPSTSQGVFGGSSIITTGTVLNSFTQFALAPDDRTLVLPDRGNARVLLYDPQTGAELASLPTATLPTAVDISPDGTTAVVSHEGTANTITRIDLVAHAVSDTFTTPESLGSQVIRITPDKAAAVASINGAVAIVDLSSGLVTSIPFFGAVGDILLSYDGKYALATNKNAPLIDLGTKKLIKTLAGYWGGPGAASPVDYRAVVANHVSGDHVQIYSLNGAAGQLEGNVLSGEPPEGDATRTLAVSGDGTVAVTTNHTSQNACILDLAGGSVEAYVPVGDNPLGVAVTPDGAYAVVTNQESDNVHIIDVAAATVVKTLPVPEFPTEVTISPDGQWAYVTTIAGYDRVYFIKLDGASSSVAKAIPAGQLGSITYTYNAFSGIRLSPDGSLLAVCVTFDQELLLIDTATQSEIARVPVGNMPFRAAFSPDGTRVYVGNAFSDNLYIVKVQGGSSFVEGVVPGIDFPLTVNVDAAGAYVYVGSFGSSPSIKVVDASSKTVVKTVPLTGQPRATHLSVSDSVLHVAAADGQFVRISAAGPASAVIDSTPLSGGPSDMAFSETLGLAVVAQPVPDGVDLVRLAAGDCDDDGDVDLDDHDQFAACLSGPGTAHGAGCGCTDFDADGDTDLRDFDGLQRVFTGSLD